jgi:hypothetical protein
MALLRTELETLLNSLERSATVSLQKHLFRGCTRFPVPIDTDVTFLPLVIDHKLSGQRLQKAMNLANRTARPTVVGLEVRRPRGGFNGLGFMEAWSVGAQRSVLST